MATLKSVTEDLIVAVAKTGKDTPRFRALKRRVDESLKSSLHGRTDQFAVAKQLEGLQEKFRVLNRDDLADALQPRLAELEEHPGTLFPEILSLFLQLADRPAQLSEVHRVEKLQPKQEEKQLTWTDLDATGTAYCHEDIWESVDYAADSSDEDDVSSISSGTQPSRSFTQVPAEDDYVIPDEIFSSGEDEDLLNAIQSVQFWRDENVPKRPEGGKGPNREVTELQMLREVVFMLQGLPTSLLWRLDGNIEVDRRYKLSHLSQEALSSLLRSISACGAKIDILRQFAKTPQSIAHMQTFHRSVEGCLHEFDKFLSDIQCTYVGQRSSITVSLLQFSDDVQRESKLLILLADLVSNLTQRPSKDGIRCLDLLFDLVCNTQAAGDDENCAALAHIFFLSLETYIRSFRAWMESGVLESPADSSFISENREKTDLRTLWHDWYVLDSQANIPKFIRPFAQRIFITGKSMVFLKRLNITEGLEAPKNPALSFEDVYPPDSASLCLPFYALLESAFGKLVNQNHSLTSNLLRTELNEQCGLWVSLQALEHIHLCKDISLTGPIDTKVFELIDRGKGGWSDRFLLTEIAQTAFGSVSFIDPTRLIVRSARNADNRNRSVKIFSNLSFDYILPWPVANIITKDGVAAYQRISTLLMQIRRARYAIVKQRLRHIHQDSTHSNDKTLGYAVRHNLLWFLNTLYSHLTGFVISSASDTLRKSLAGANDVDGMIATHRSYMASLEEQCLLSKNLLPLYQATISLLDLCIFFADLQASRAQYSNPDYTNSTKTPRKQIPGRPFKTGAIPTPRKTRYEYSYGDEEDTDSEELDSQSEDQDEDESENEDGAVDGPWPRRRNRRSSRPSQSEAQYIQQLKDVQDQFDRLVAFLTAGLKGIGRVDGQVSWEMLSEKLEWRKERASGYP